jgi:hypothetical protein
MGQLYANALRDALRKANNRRQEAQPDDFGGVENRGVPEMQVNDGTINSPKMKAARTQYGIDTLFAG